MIDEIIKQLKPLINGKLIYLSQYGSHLYGLNTENSDLDFRGVYIPTLDDIILHKDKDEINTELEIYLPPEHLQQKQHVLGEIYMQPIVSEKGKQVNGNRDNLKKVDIKLFSLQKFIQLCSKADTNALDLLFSWRCEHVEQYITKTGSNIDCNDLSYIQMYRNKLINTDRLESPITYAFKQATKYSLKGNYLNLYDELLSITKDFTDDKTVLNLIEYIDKNGLKYDKSANFWNGQIYPVTKGTKEKGGELTYLHILGVEHQDNLSIRTFEERIKSKVSQYSKRAINSKDGGNDWKALSHAVRVLLEIQELLETGNIKFPLYHKDFLLDIKLGKVKREVIDEYFKEHLSGIMECMEQNTLGWKYDEEFWNEFILEAVKDEI